MPKEPLKKTSGKRPSTRSTSRLKVETAIRLHQTKPLKAGHLARLQKQIKSTPTANSTVEGEPIRKKPESQIQQAEKLNFWFIPARIAFLLNGIYFLLFSLVAVLHIMQSHRLIQTFFTLPFDPTLSSNYLLEMVGSFALLGGLLMFHAARHPKKYSWFYFFLVLFALPFSFLSNLSKLQTEIPEQFYNFIYYDTVVVAVLWAIYLLSMLSYFKTIKENH
ncbi:MAG: hypothetical protein ACRCZE_02185 [Candidatus Altimarinota bacterium]